jgi:hypothetical protein
MARTAECSPQNLSGDFGISFLKRCIATYKSKEYQWKLKESEMWKDFQSVFSHGFFSVRLLKFLIARAKDELMAYMHFTKYQCVKYAILIELEFDRDCALPYSESWQGFADFDSRDLPNSWWKKINKAFDSIDETIDAWTLSIPEEEVLTLVKFRYCKAKAEFALTKVQQPGLIRPIARAAVGQDRTPPISSYSSSSIPTPTSSLV